MVEKTVLGSGLVVISEYRPEFPSFALSYTVRSGARAETKDTNGFHHFVEHMMFKGSERYSLIDIADQSDRLGGRLNAFTGKEISQYHIKSIEEKFTDSFDLLTDIVINSTFPQNEFVNEKSVILQEIYEYEDDPDTFAFESFYEILFGDNGIAYPITGRVEQVSGYDRDMVYGYYKQHYVPGNLLLAAVGKVKHEHLVKSAEKAFVAFPSGRPVDFSFALPGFHFHSDVKHNPSLKQVYAIVGFAGIPTESPLKYEFMVMNDILGAGMSSRLFQKIREEKGLAYTINSFPDTYLDCGILLVYAIIEPGKSEEYLQAVKEEIVKLKDNGITEDELNRAKDHIKSSVILSLEGNVSKMNFVVKQELFLSRELTMKEIIENIDKVTKADIDRLLNDFLDLRQNSIFLYGNIKPGIFPGNFVLDDVDSFSSSKS